MSSPFVLIDDTNSSIQYSGSWFEIKNTQINTGSYGRPFQDTLHGVNVTAYFSFPFSGSGVIVYGTSITTNASGTQDPTWECFIDNTSIGWSPAPSTSENNWILCGGGPGQFQDGHHLLTVKANVSNHQTFWFDHIQYAPSAGVSQNQSLLRIDSSDSAIQYSSGWQSSNEPISYTQFSENTSYTQISGATLTYQFFGTLISWVGYTPQPGTPTSSTYAIDDQTPISFPVPASPDTYFNQILFKTGDLSFGQHKLVITYFGNSTTVPLALNYFVLHGAPSSNNTSTSSTSVPSASSSNSSHSSSTTIHGKPIIGGVIGGLVLISLLLALFFFIRRRNNRRSQTVSEVSITPYDDPSPDVVTPFTVLPSNLNSTFQPQNYTSNGQSLPSQFISSKFTGMRQPSDPSSMSSSGGIPPLTPLRQQLSSPAVISPSSPRLPLSTGSQNNFDNTRDTIPQAATEPLMQQRSASPRDSNARFLLHEDSGVRIPSAENDVVELPPFYTPR